MAATAVGLAVGGATPEASAPCTGKGEECVCGGERQYRKEGCMMKER